MYLVDRRLHKMNGNTEMLNFIFQNSEMGINTIGQIVELTIEPEFKKQLNSQLAEYEMINKEAKDMLNKHGCEEKGINSFDKIKTYLMINIQTLTDKSASHISEMLIIGSNMGVIDAVKNIHKYLEAEKDIVKLMQRLLKFEQENIKQLTEFL